MSILNLRCESGEGMAGSGEAQQEILVIFYLSEAEQNTSHNL